MCISILSHVHVLKAREEGEDPSSTSSEAEDSDDGEASGGEELPVGMQCASS